MDKEIRHAEEENLVSVQAGGVVLHGNLTIPAGAVGIVLFAHGSGSSRHSPRNRHVAQSLQRRGLGTLLIDLLTLEEEAVDLHTAHLRFDIGLLAERLTGATDWLTRDRKAASQPLGYFGASTGAAAALIAAAERPTMVRAVVSRGGRPDLAGSALERVQAPALLIVGGADEPVISLNEQAAARLRAVHHIEIIPGATHLFEEPGTLDQVARLAADWFIKYLPAKDTA